VSDMTDDYYNFDERQMAMIGERQAKVFRIGDPVNIKVVNVDVDERMIDFQIVGMPLPRKERSQRPSRGKTIQAKPLGKSLDKSNDDKKGKKKQRKPLGKSLEKTKDDKKGKKKHRKGKKQRNKNKQASGNTKHKPCYKDKKVKNKARKKKK